MEYHKSVCNKQISVSLRCVKLKTINPKEKNVPANNIP